MAGEIVERTPLLEDLLLVGIRTRGVPLAERIGTEIERMEGVRPPMGVVDITLYRDDLSRIGPHPIVGETRFPEPLDDRVVVLCDDVLYTGRTVMAALDSLRDWGRPRAVRLAVLVDRGHRELPIRADVVGTTVTTSLDQHVEVRFESVDGEEGVTLKRNEESA